MPASRINGFSIAYTAIGGILLWSGIDGTTISETFRGLLKGTAPKPAPPDNLTVIQTVSGTGPNAGVSLPSTAIAAKNQAIGKLLAAPYGWSTGTEWNDLVALWNRESGWDNLIENPSSGAYGIAQALGHGPTNQYPAGPANPPISSATAQIAWGLSYIKSTYGSPSAAWAHELAEGYY